MRKWLIPITSFIAVYLVFLIILMPANLVRNWVNLPNGIQISDIKGSIWHSRVNTVKIEQFTLSNIRIKLNPLSLFTLNPQLNVTFGDALTPGAEGQVTINGLLSDLQFSNVQVNIRANDLVPYLNLPVPVTAHQFIDISLNSFVVGKAVCQRLSGNIRWNKAAVTTFNEKVVLGSLSALLSCQDGDAVLTLNEQNDLGLSFSASLGEGLAASGDGYLTPNNKTPKAIQQILPFLGKADNQGRYRLRF